jgi:hypothetical protein
VVFSWLAVACGKKGSGKVSIGTRILDLVEAIVGPCGASSEDIRLSVNIDIFKIKLKTHLFKKSYNTDI